MNVLYSYYILVCLGEHKILTTKNLDDLIPASTSTIQKHLKYLEKINIVKSTKTNKYRLWELNYNHIIDLKKADERL